MSGKKRSALRTQQLRNYLKDRGFLNVNLISDDVLADMSLRGFPEQSVIERDLKRTAQNDEIKFVPPSLKAIEKFGLELPGYVRYKVEVRNGVKMRTKAKAREIKAFLASEGFERLNNIPDETMMRKDAIPDLYVLKQAVKRMKDGGEKLSRQTDIAFAALEKYGAVVPYDFQQTDLANTLNARNKEKEKKNEPTLSMETLNKYQKIKVGNMVTMQDYIDAAVGNPPVFYIDGTPYSAADAKTLMVRQFNQHEHRVPKGTRFIKDYQAMRDTAGTMSNNQIIILYGIYMTSNFFGQLDQHDSNQDNVNTIGMAKMKIDMATALSF